MPASSMPCALHFDSQPWRPFSTLGLPVKLVAQPAAHAAINMMMRLTGQAPNLHLFTTEAEGLAWLDGLEV